MKRFNFSMFCLFVGCIMLSIILFYQDVQAAEKVRIGVPLCYGPQNQPWQRGMARALERLEEHNVEIVTLRGVPSGDSERATIRRLLNMKVASTLVGPYTKRSESIAIAQEAKEKGVNLVGMMSHIVEFPSVLEDAWEVAVILSRKMLEDTGGEGGVLYTAESPGFYAPFDQMCTFLESYMKYQPRMKLFPRVDGGVSTEDQISISRKNFSAVFRANPEPGSIKVIMSFWWPPTIGAVQAMRDLGRDKENILVYNQYLSKTFLEEMAKPESPIVGTCDTDWRWTLEKVADLMVSLAKGEMKAKEEIFWNPAPYYPKEKANELLDWMIKTDEWTHNKLKQYGG